MLKKIISVVYIVAALVMLVCYPVSAIMIIIKLCADAVYSWLVACIPLIMAISATPFAVVGKNFLDEKGK